MGIKGAVANVVEGIETWDDFIDFVDNLEENRKEIGSQIQTIVFDTVNAGYELITPYVLKFCSRKDNTVYRDVADMQNAKSSTNFWVERDRLFKEQIDRIIAMKFSILFLTHLTVKTIKPKKAEPYDVYSSTMPNRLEALIYPLVDFILTGERRETTDENGNVTKKRVLLTKGNTMATAGNRVFIEEDIMFDTEDEAMEKYQAAFKESVIKKLNEAGIKEDFDTLSKKQQKEKEEKIQNIIKEKSVEELYEEFKTIVSGLKDKSVAKNEVDKLGIELKDVKNLDAKALKGLIENISK